MKKEIKKLQRFRDQVKQWAASNDVKDKNPLLDARRRIEVEMERFKVIEKETKTKAFSKEGLAAARVAKDPKEKAKDEAREWIAAAIEEMNAQIETFEGEIDSLTSSSRKKSSKTSVGNSRLTHLEESMSRHHQHIARLELCSKLVEDDALEPADAEDLKDLVEDYLERNQEDFDEFVEPEDMYADLDLDELEELAARNKASSVNIAAELALAAKADGGVSAKKPAESAKPAGETAGAGSGKDEDGAKEAATHRDGGAKAPKGHEAPASAKKPIPAPVGKAGVLGGVSGLPAPLGLPRDGGGDGGGGKAIPGPKGASAANPREGALGGNGGSWGAPGGGGADGRDPGSGLQQQSWSFPPGGGGDGARDGTHGTGDSRTGPGVGPGPAYAATSPTPPAPGSSKFPLPVPGGRGAALNAGPAARAQPTGLGSPQPGSGPGSGSPGGKGLPAPLAFPKSASGSNQHQTEGREGRSRTEVEGRVSGGSLDAGGSSETTEREANDGLFALPPALAELLEESLGAGAATAPRFGDGPGGPGSSADGPRGAAERETTREHANANDGLFARRVPGVRLGGLTHHDPAVNLRLLEASHRVLPGAADGAWSARRREPPSVATPPSYPTTEPPVLDNPALFERLDADALFFTFYYQQGTARQYLAARELKRANWRFHKKHAAWFARQEEPKASTDLYEQGAYIYFDASSSDKSAGVNGGWCQRSKPDFVFHYSQLESELV